MAKKQISAETLAILKEADNIRKIQLRNNCIIEYNQYIGTRKRNQTTFVKHHSDIPKGSILFEQKENNNSSTYTNWLKENGIVSNELEDYKSTTNNVNYKSTYSGEFTLGAKKRLRKAIEILNLLNPKTYKIHPISKRKELHSLSFVTLTIPDNTLIHPAKAYNKLLRPFLQYLSKTHKLKYYIWKLEWQKRGQLHYHLTTDIMLHWKIIRNKWNYLISKAGLNTEYLKKYGHTNANSTDIKKVYKEMDMTSYLQKEFQKSMQNINPNLGKYNKEEECLKYKIWDCTTNIKSHKYFNIEIDEEQSTLLQLCRLEENNLLYTKYNDNCNIHIPLGIKTKELLTHNNALQYSIYLDKIRQINTLKF